MNLALLANAVLLAGLLAGSHALLRHAATLGESLFSYPRIAYTGWALAVYVAIFGYYSVLLERLPLSGLYPVYTGLSVAFVYITGVAVFGESLSQRGIIGIALLIGGVLLVAEYK